MRNLTVFFILLFTLTWLPNFGYADTTVIETSLLFADHEISQDSFEKKINALNNRTDLDEALKNKLLNFYRAANENLRNDEWFQFLAKNYQESIEHAAVQLKDQQTKLTNFQAQQFKQPELFTALTLEQLEQKLTLEKTNLTNIESQISQIETNLSFQQSRSIEIRQETETARLALDEGEKNSEIFKLLAETELERDARQLQFKTLQNKLNSQLKMLGLEAISQPERVDLLKSQLQLLQLQKQVLLPIIGELDKNLAQRQQLEAQHLKNKLLQVEKESLHKHPVIQAITKENINYSLELQAISRKLERNNQVKQQWEARTQEIENDFKSAEKKISLAGLSPALGKILREQRYKLARLDQFNQQTKYIQNETAYTSLAEFKLEYSLKQLVDVEAKLENIMNFQVALTLSASYRKQIETELCLLLNEQKDVLNKLSKADSNYLRNLGDYDFAKQQLLKQADKYALYLDERLLWVPSSASINKDYFINLYTAFKWLFSFSHWQKVTLDLFKETLAHFFLSLFAVLILVVLVHYQRKLRLEVLYWHTKVGLLYNDQFYFTIKVLAYTLIIILPLPLLLFFLSYFLDSSTQSTEFSLAVANGLRETVLPLFFLKLLHHLFAPVGIFEKHFNWQAEVTQLFYRHITWVCQVVIPAVFLMTMANASRNTLHSDSLGRLALVVIMLVMSLGLAKILHPERGVLQFIIRDNLHHWAVRLRYFWYSVVIAVPLIVIGFALAGYYLSALELQQKLVITLRLGFVIIILRELVLRWLTLVNQHLALKNTQQETKVTVLNSEQATDGELENQNIVLLNIPKINQQTTTLLNVTIGLSLLIGIWIIWKNILPAFSFLDEIVLWQHMEVFEKKETLQSVTLINLLLAGVYLFVMLIAVNNFPGLMEILILRRFSIEIGSRYAINQLTRYLLLAIGLIFITNELGGRWSQVQWLVAALSVGLGFGLQEIFANLVSGIILLFERPIRVGDTVTIDDVTGKVSQIQMRATRIVDWDQKELIVPNKTFITDKLMNWGLSNQITRVVIGLHISYNSDVELAHRVMCETVKNTPLVLSEPKPDVYFLSFGDNGLEFSIRVYVNELSHRLLVTHDLHLRLYKVLAEHHIEIPYPQRDIHIRSIVNSV